MKKKLSLSTNKKSASEGEFIDIEWFKEVLRAYEVICKERCM